MLALKEDIAEDATDDKGIPLTISKTRGSKIDSRAIMDYLVFDRGYIEEEEKNVGKCALETAIDERYGAPTLKKKYKLNEEKVKRTTQMKKAVMNVRVGVERRRRGETESFPDWFWRLKDEGNRTKGYAKRVCWKRRS